jgi:tRNA 2-thiocytidine biosynthesis protein TtcA
VSDDGKNVVIRPGLLQGERSGALCRGQGLPIIPNLCGSQENLQRQAIKQMMQEWDRRFPGRLETMFTAIQDVIPSHLLDHQLFDFKSINRDSGIIDGGDKAFDPPELPKAPLLDIDEMDMLDVIEVR